jgi:hypothetical protein
MKNAGFCGLRHCIPFASSVPLKRAGSLKQAAHYLQGIGCPSRRVLSRDVQLCICRHLSNIFSLRHTETKYRSLHVLHSNLFDSPAVGDVHLGVGRKVPSPSPHFMGGDEGRVMGVHFPFLFACSPTKCVSKAGRARLCLCKLQPLHVCDGESMLFTESCSFCSV